MSKTILRDQILSLTEKYAKEIHTPKPFEPGKTFLPTSAKIFDASELKALVDSSLDFWLTAGRYNDAFEKRLAEYLGVKYALTTNSGSSANLLAVAALTSTSLGDKALKPGDEVISVAAAFPTTVNPLLLYGLVPVFLDIGLPDYNIICDKVEEAITDKTRAIVLAHTLGNPFNFGRIMELVKKYDLWLIEDCCDALGSTYNGRKCGTFGHLSTISFYPAHHITTGEGGAVVMNDPKLKIIVESFRDWGRDCWCATGKDNTCKKRFDWQLGKLPKGYDHKFTYSHAGFNLKITDMQAAVGYAQMDKLEGFVETRKNNFNYLKSKLTNMQDCLLLPKATLGSDPSWFGFPITLINSASGQRVKLLKYLAKHQVGTRLLFTGNITLQPYFKYYEYRISGKLDNTNRVMNDCFWIGVYPGLNGEMLDYIANTIMDYFNSNV